MDARSLRRHRRFLRTRPWVSTGMLVMLAAALSPLAVLSRGAVPYDPLFPALAGPLGLVLVAAGELSAMGTARWRWLRRKGSLALAFVGSPARIGRAAVAVALWPPFGLALCVLLLPERISGPAAVRLARGHDALTDRACTFLGIGRSPAKAR